MKIEFSHPSEYSINLKGLIKINDVFGSIKMGGPISVQKLKDELNLSHYHIVDYALGYLIYSGNISQYNDDSFVAIKSKVDIKVNVIREA
jgi:hypothetical protein